MTDFYAAVFIGLLGAGHCLAMCGGVASAMTFSIEQKQRPGRQLLAILFYNLGRGISYIVAGMVIAGGAAALSQFFEIKSALLWLRLLSAIMMLLLALYISKVWQGLQKIEALGQYFWRFIQPLASRLMPIKHPLMALPFGMVWGWLPCGLVYSSLSWAAVSGNALQGGLIMAGFALGTFPAMFSLGLFSNYLKSLLNSLWFRWTGSAMLAIYAVHTGYIALSQMHYLQ
ncbi:sulfite exporter TauE/SafE family protein [Motilimonas cestriensis]|uniref:Sulfite exporter TauE/SafE family protein n=1 Tax=Motilimonas cestriensis TaxID=2742685 RepID=A0ABS8WIF1_9GAMM|nr:sulfite exporter TauE/SafE family protein [Motilimonas cestriensis]MCE2597140.1 sulfite exporter TauE/SafE family protein [Motilimonas cestriensis]